MQWVTMPAIALALAGAGAGAVATYQLTAAQQPRVACRPGAVPLAHLELLFGMSRKDGGEVTEAEWHAFLEEEVSPRFPEGLVVFTGYGQWRTRAGRKARENSHVVEVWYRPSADSDAKIEAIRSAYKARFSQESVMRVDGVSCVSF
jgi:hypothetical protein